MDVYEQIVVKIIKSQENIIGPVAVEQASQVSNLKINWPKEEVSIGGDEAKAIDQLISKYKDLFGQISVEVSKEAAASLIGKLPAGELPEALK
jgi:nitric oxide reductase large subunit